MTDADWEINPLHFGSDPDPEQSGNPDSKPG